VNPDKPKPSVRGVRKVVDSIKSNIAELPNTKSLVDSAFLLHSCFLNA